MKPSKKGLAVCAIVVLGFLAIHPAAAQETVTININEAPVHELTELEGVGPKKAERIVEYREENGFFKAPEDIMKVKGIGPKTWEKNRDRITVE